MGTIRRIGVLLCFAAALSLSLPERELALTVGVAEAKGKKRKRVRKTKVCKNHKGKRRCRWLARFSGHNAAVAKLRVEPPTKPSGKLHIYARNSREELEINIYDQRGDFDDAALAALDKLFRCRRSGKIRAGDPRLYQTLSSIYDEFGERIDLTSGFRYHERASSRHNHGAAADISIPGVSAGRLYEFVSGLDAGGMGIGLYPRSGFIHVDWRAPGAKSYRWTDYSPPGSSGKKKRKKQRKTRERKPNV